MQRCVLAVRQPAEPRAARAAGGTASRSVARQTCGSGYYESKHFIVDLKPQIREDECERVATS